MSRSSTRIAFISDIHAHAIALEAVLADIEKRHVDRLVCLGDVATIGFQPREVVNRLRRLDCVFVRGNHDAALLQPDLVERYQIVPALLDNVAWCAGQLTPADYDFLRDFKPVIHIPLNDEREIVCFHGSPNSPTDLILATTDTAVLDEMYRGYDGHIMIGGHSHIQMMRRYNERLLINPGSVGNAFRAAYSPGGPPVLLPWSEYGILEWQDDQLSIELRRVSFDIAHCIDVIKASGVPNEAWWLAQYMTG